MQFKKIYLGLECVVLFGAIPGALIWLAKYSDVPFFPVLFVFLLITICITILDKDMRFMMKSKADKAHRPPHFKKAFLLKILGSGLFLLGLTAIFYQGLLLRLPREQPRLWLMIMVLYPILSVAPQEFLFRTFFMQRYQKLFGSETLMLCMNALAFAWAHAFFLNWIAPLLSLVAGWLLAKTWQQTKSFKWVCLEHAIYGQLVFTSGIGWFFYTGSTRAIENLSFLTILTDLVAFS